MAHRGADSLGRARDLEHDLDLKKALAWVEAALADKPAFNVVYLKARILAKLGLRFEAYLKDEKEVRGQLVDSLLCGLSREDWLRARAATHGATRREGRFAEITRDADGMAVVNFYPKGAAKSAPPEQVRARVVVGADGGGFVLELT